MAHRSPNFFLKYGPSPASFRVIIAKRFTISITTDILTIKMGMSAPCWLGLSSRPGLTQRREGVQGRYAPLSLGYLQAGVVTMVPTAVDTMSSWCSVGFIEDDLVCNFEEQIKVRTEYRMNVNYKKSICDRTIFVESERVYNDKFRKKANSNYELTINFYRNKKQERRWRGSNPRSPDPDQWSEAKIRLKRGRVALCLSSVSLLYGSTFSG